MKKQRSNNKKYIDNQRYDKGSFFFDEAHYQRSCVGKNGYDTEWQAKFAAEETMERSNVNLSWYRCDFCGKWHLTSRN